MSDQPESHWMKELHWQVVQYLAADLVRYKTDLNLVEKVMHHIVNNADDLDFKKLLRWMNAQLKYAQYFPRSQRSTQHIRVVREMVGYLGQSGMPPEARSADGTPYMAEMLGWVARTARYFQQDKNALNAVIKEMDGGYLLLLEEPKRNRGRGRR